jgi:hypothetical protein
MLVNSVKSYPQRVVAENLTEGRIQVTGSR